MGVADGVIAFLVVAFGLTLVSRGPHEFDEATVRAAFRVYRNAASVLLVLIIVFFTAGRRINWMVLLIGLAWRCWLAAWVLPSALALWNRSGADAGRSV